MQISISISIVISLFNDKLLRPGALLNKYDQIPVPSFIRFGEPYFSWSYGDASWSSYFQVSSRNRLRATSSLALMRISFASSFRYSLSILNAKQRKRVSSTGTSALRRVRHWRYPLWIYALAELHGSRQHRPIRALSSASSFVVVVVIRANAYLVFLISFKSRFFEFNLLS